MNMAIKPPPAGTYTKYSALKVDGVLGTVTKEYFQRFLKYQGHYSGVIDGSLGPMSVKAIQRLVTKAGWYNRAIDGDFGNYTRWALGSYIAFSGGFNQWTPSSLAAYQVMYTSPQQWSPQPWGGRWVHALQRGLNVNARYSRIYAQCVHNPKHQ